MLVCWKFETFLIETIEHVEKENNYFTVLYRNTVCTLQVIDSVGFMSF